jgi:hypothetical protein
MAYYGCDWLVRPGADYELMMRTAAALGCHLVQIDTRTDAAGCLYVVLALNVPDESVLADYIHHAGQQLGLTDWYLVEEADYQRGDLFLDLDGLAGVPDLLQNILNRLDEQGYHNQENCPELLS